MKEFIIILSFWISLTQCTSNGRPTTPEPLFDGIWQSITQVFHNLLTFREPSERSRFNESDLFDGMSRQNYELMASQTEINELADSSSSVSQKIRLFRELPQMKRRLFHFAFSVRRDSLILDAFAVAAAAGSWQLLGDMHVTFIDERASDAGGVTKDFLSSLSGKLMDPQNRLFSVPEGETQPYINSASETEHFAVKKPFGPSHLDLFRFVGRVMAWCIFQRIPFNGDLRPTFFKVLFDMPLTMEDARVLGPGFHASMSYLSKASSEELDTLDAYFVADERSKINLKDNGDQIKVSPDNRDDFIRLKVQYELEGRFSAQFDAMRRGLFGLIPRELFDGFNANELVILFCGSANLYVSDWKRYTVYSGHTANSPTVKLFWRVVESFNARERQALLYFTTGVSRLPPGGFAALSRPFRIAKGHSGRLPTAHTCSNTLDLPEYSRYEVMREKLLLAIMGSEGFGFA